MQGGIWQTIADALFWLQLLWVFSGFVLMAYLAFKVFPGPANPTQPDGHPASGTFGSHDKPIEPGTRTRVAGSVGSLPAKS
ncbi:MAG: hypothetical protein JOZ10_11970 [Acidobacteria bacterium]|nr:hypothetical protein [Acidobacteriota bacterium]MBV9435122.1 hypothetical protein [Acidobacteriota bacterium]